ncbi:hypothetical protein GY21_16660 [Cryobacterium roopkundense]|uniref:D-alanyl-D-alanine carboxypeptidase-like core domain-containing protein n=1 Tax=Cryobacterium roopkundense TaxID=1001240 RepID=A0A099J469_9MICO|nr:hypothetical protein GY21_16660 [Cryobacterium roopkundense]
MARPGGVSRPARHRLIAILAFVMLAAASVAGGALSGTTRSGTPHSAPASSTTPTADAPLASATPRPAPAALQAPVPVLGGTALSLEDPASLWVVVNKQRPLRPADYSPTDLVAVPVAHTWQPQLRQEASGAVVNMFAAARDEAGLTLASNSAYRGFAAQTRVYDAAVAARGTASADSGIARPGSSEHQTGLAIDVGAVSGRCSLNACFGETSEGRWLAENAGRFGFLLRYPADKVPVTGYEFEPWHFRYIGTDLAADMHERGITTLEEFFGLPPAPGYP